MSKILIVEDDLYLRRDIKEVLETKGYEVVAASCVREALEYIYKNAEIDLYLLDLWLPDGDGFHICEEIRKRNLKPVIFLTVCDNEENVVRGLNMGADDYVTKPFRPGELLSRIQANLRRGEYLREQPVLKSGELVLDISREEVLKSGDLLKLSPLEYRLLRKLMENGEQIVKREQLLNCLWDFQYEGVEDNTLSVNMSRLRSKLGGDYIETIRGFGYRFRGKIHRGLKV